MRGLQLPSKVILNPGGKEFLIVHFRGAALSGMSTEATVTSISATRHYGTECWGRYDIIQDRGRPIHVAIDDDIVTDKVSIFITCLHLAVLIRTQMMWYIHRGDDLSKSTRIPFTLQGNYTQHEYDTEDLWLYGQLYESQEEYVQITSQMLILIELLIGLFRTAPRYPTGDKTFRTNCKLVCNLSKVPKHLFKKHISEL